MATAVFLFIAFIIIAIGVLLMLREMKPAARKVWADRFAVLWAWCWKHGQELVGLPIALCLFFFSGAVLKWLEPTSAIYDAGVLQGITVAVIHLLVGNSMARIGCTINLPWFSKSFNEARDQKWLFVTYFGGYCLLASLL
jgi:hypothetical protein